MELHSTPVEVKAALKYVAVLALHSRGWLDKHNCVPKRIEGACGAWKESYGSAQDFSCVLEQSFAESFGLHGSLILGLGFNCLRGAASKLLIT